MSHACSETEEFKDTVYSTTLNKYLHCNACNKKFMNLPNLKNHLRSHFDENYYVICDVCGKSISHWKLKGHLEQHDPKSNVKEIKKSECRWCGLIFDKLNNRASHEMRIHKMKSNDGLDNFKCQVCFVMFRTKDDLRDHSFEHYKGKIHICDFPGCGRYFKMGKLLTVHKRCHYTAQFKCLDCGKMFVQTAGLSKHRKNRCPMKKLEGEKILPSQTELNRIADIAKQQYISLNGRLFRNQNSKCVGKKSKKVESSLEIDSNKNHSQGTHHDGMQEIVRVEIKEETNGEDENEEWQYEFLDEAFSELHHASNAVVLLEKLAPNELKQWKNDEEYSLLPKNDCELIQGIDEKRTNTQIRKITKINLNENSNYICDLCGFTNLRSKHELQKHLKNHRKAIYRKPFDTYKCDVQECKAVFTSNSQLTQHKRGYHGVRVCERVPEAFICDLCGKNFWTRASIQTHLLVTHKTIAEYNCNQCCRKFKSHGNLYRHVKAVHSNEKSFGCEKCGRMFKERYQLEIHLHNHDPPTECHLCGRMVANMKVHLRHHAAKSNNTMTKCPMCSKMVGKYQLLRHIKAVHEKQFQKDCSKLNLKVYTCKDCGDLFSRRNELRQHEYFTHSNTKLYECKICGTYFKKLKLLNVHRFTHQPMNIKCEICNKVYARKGALWKHQKKNHPEIIVRPC